MTRVLSSASDYYFSFTMPCGFNGDSVDFDTVVVESEFCAGDWALPSPVCATNNTVNNSNNTNSGHVLGNLHNLDTVGNFNFADQSGLQRRNSVDIMEDSSLVTDELKSRLLGKYDGDCAKMETDEFDGKRDKGDQKGNDVNEAEEEDEDELFFQPPRRISMLWNSKLRWKEERKKVLKISINKLRRIEDPELFLCRSVLINNTVRRLHREIREEKMARYPEIHRPVPVTSCIPETFPPRKRDYKEYNVATSPSCCDKENREDNPSRMGDDGQTTTVEQETEGSPPIAKRMRQTTSCGDEANCNPMVSCRVSGDGPLARHPTTGETSPPSPMSPMSPMSLQQQQQPCPVANSQHVTGGHSTSVTSNDRSKAKCDPSRPQTGDVQREDKLTSSLLMTTENVIQATKDRSRGIVSEYEKQYSQYSCGQLSIFGELQSVVFHSLIASLES